MSKIYTFILIIPIFLIFLYRFITLYEYDTKQRYLKDVSDAVAQKVKITGVFTIDDLNEFKQRIRGTADFEDNGSNKAILLKTCSLSENADDEYEEYTIGKQLQKGDLFCIQIKSANVSLFSKLHNRGINPNDENNLYYKARSECRVEYVP